MDPDDYTNNDTHDADYTPEEAYNRYQPIHRRVNGNGAANNNNYNNNNNPFNSPPAGRITADDILAIMTNQDGGGGADSENPRMDFSGAAENAAYGGPGPWNATRFHHHHHLNGTFSDHFITPPEVRGAAGGSEDGIVLPALFSAIGLCAVVGNLVVLFAFLGFRRMRSGQNLMLANVAVADLLFALATVPAAVLNHAGSPLHGGHHSSAAITPPQLCRFVHYVVFVGVYVSVYTLVVTCVFRFFGEFMRGGGGGKAPPRGGTIFSAAAGSRRGAAAPSLTLGNAAVSCAVIWIAFMTSHVNFLIQSDGAVFDEPFVCEQYDGPMDTAKLRTLWVTFLTCACLLPLLIVCTLSSLILRNTRPVRALTPPLEPRSAQRLASIGRGQHGRLTGCSEHGEGSHGVKHGGKQGDKHGGEHGVMGDSSVEQPTRGGFLESRSCYTLESERGECGDGGCGSQGNGHRNRGDFLPFISIDDDASCEGPGSRRQPAAATEYEAAQNGVNESRSLRDLTVAVLASTIARCLCWLPIQIFVLFDAFAAGAGGGPQGPIGNTAAYRKAELAAVCLAFAATCLNPLVYQCVCVEFRRAYAAMFSRCCRCCGGCGGEGRRRRQGVAVVPPAGLYGRRASGRPGETNMTILSIISDSSNRINYV